MSHGYRIIVILLGQRETVMKSCFSAPCPANHGSKITYDAAQTTIPALQSAIKDTGYEIKKPVHGEDGKCLRIIR